MRVVHVVQLHKNARPKGQVRLKARPYSACIALLPARRSARDTRDTRGDPE